MRRTQFVKALALGVMALASVGVSAQENANRPIVIVNSLLAGPSDIQARMIASGLQKRWNQTVLVETKQGAGGLIAHRAVARSKPDGRTLLFATTQFTGLIVSHKDPQYKLEDFVLLAPVSISGQAMMVSTSVPANSVAEFIQYAKAHPTALNYASLGAGGIGMLVAERLKQAGDFQMTEIPYKGAPQAQLEVMAGRVHVYFSGIGNAKQGVIASRGSIKLLAVTGETRSMHLPDVPTFKELGYPMVISSTWSIMVAPVGMPSDITRRLRSDIAAILASPEVEETLTKLSFEPWRISIDQLDAFLNADLNQMKGDFARLNIPLQ